MKGILNDLMNYVLPEAQAGISDMIMKNLKADQPKEQINVGPSLLTTQPMEVPDVPNLEQLHPNEIQGYTVQTEPDNYLDSISGLLEGRKVGRDRSYARESDDEAKAQLRDQMTGKEDIKVLRTDNQAKDLLTEYVKKYENENEMGRVDGPDGELFTVFDVPGSPIGEKNIGWGFKVEPEMLTDDQSKWPKANGIPIDLRKGISRDTAMTLLHQELEKARDVCKAQMPGWDKMTPMEKFFWNDLAFNSGPEVFKKSPKAVKAAKAGYTAEAAMRELDFIHSGKKQMRGLFNRRIASYNQMAKELPGVPEIEEAEWGEDVRVKFAHRVESTKVSKAYAKKINDSTDGWFTVTKGEKGRKSKVYKI